MRDLREWIKTADKSKILRRVKEETDVRKISAILNEDRKQPVLFQNLTGYDCSLIGQTISCMELVAFALGVEPTKEAITEEYAKRVSNPLKPVYVKSALCQEVVDVGDDVDLTKFPIPLQHTRDGGPYISAGVLVCKDPGTYIAAYEEEINLGMYRHMLYTKNMMGIDFVSANRTNVFYKKLLEEGKPLEVAVLIGLHPLALMASVVPERDIEIMGGLLQKPVELVPCKTVDLHVPNNAELVIEGEIPPIGWSVPEGPFGEFTGYQSERKENPVVNVKAITHRKNFIFHTVTIGTEDYLQTDTANITLAQTLQKENTLKALRKQGFDLRDINTMMGFTIISMKKWFEGQARSLIYRFGNIHTHYPKFLIVVDEDIDVSDPGQVERALTQRCKPDEDIIIKTGIPARPLDPSNLTHTYNTTSSRMGIDATKPLPPFAKRHEWIMSTVPFEEEIPIGRKFARDGKALRNLVDNILNAIKKEPLWYHEVLQKWSEYEYRSILLAMTQLYEEKKILQNDVGQWESI
jgi:2,5-furandicarboxylate decarboxylase 1